MPRQPIDLLQGTLDLIVLRTLSWGPMHGFGIARWIQQTTEAALQVEEGSLYPALYRMENRGWIKAQWALTENGRRAKYYRLTAGGAPPARPPKRRRGTSSPARSARS